MSAKPATESRDPTLREIRATLSTVWYEIFNRGGSKTRDGQAYKRIYDHMAWLLDAYLFDVDDSADDGGRS